MYYIGVDLGSTNIKVALYNQDMSLIDRQSYPVDYIRENGFVEFDADKYFESLTNLIASMITANKIPADQVSQITLTGQAESLVVVDKDGNTLMNAISWMDERSVEECKVLAEQFTPAEIEVVTGQMAVLPTWPATKILWLKKHRPELIRGQLAENFFRTGSKMAFILKLLMSWQLTHFLTLPDFVAFKYRDRKNLGTFLSRKLWGAQGVSWTLKTQAELDTAETEGWIPIFEGFAP